MIPLVRDASTELVRALKKRAGGAALSLMEMRSRPWASATFSGARHEVSLRIDGDGAGPAADGFVSGIEAAEFTLRGHIVADIAVIGVDPVADDCALIRLEALTVEDC